MQFMNLSSESIIEKDIAHVAARTDTSALHGAKVLLLGANGLVGSYLVHFFDYLNNEKHAGIEIDCVTKRPPQKN